MIDEMRYINIQCLPLEWLDEGVADVVQDATCTAH